MIQRSAIEIYLAGIDGSDISNFVATDSRVPGTDRSNGVVTDRVVRVASRNFVTDCLTEDVSRYVVDEALNSHSSPCAYSPL